MSTECTEEYPVWALVPKRETNVPSFLNKFPEYDGRGVVIGILDSGIDPGAKGLQWTSDNKRKIIEMIDATGAGDVNTSVVVEASGGFIQGLTHRQLKIPTHWTNPTGKYHIGIKNAYELYPKLLKDRLIKERKEKYWDPFHKELIASVTRKVQEFADAFPNVNKLNVKEKLAKEELDAQLEAVNTLEKKYTDLGPTYDCIVFHDGEKWRVAIDTSETGDLESCTLLGTYSETYEYAMLTPEDRLNYVVNVYDDGNLLEIVTQSTAHGTHVASIAAACFPDDPDKNGVAPGAQLISIGIGDVRINAMETGAALARGLIKVINSKCDVINMSYGEHSHWLGGRVMDLMHQAINRHNVIMVCSAGNHGPALSTLGTPPSIPSNSIIGVGAFVSPDMMVAEYSLIEKTPGINYTWSSRGPALDGGMGISVSAPGGAITSVPNWTLRGSQLMNGTSMSSPHVAGCISLLLSGLKQQHLYSSPYSIRRAIENTALKVSTYDPLSMGHGLIQVEKAYDHLIKFSDSIERSVRFHVTCAQKNGIYLRETARTSIQSAHVINVEPMFLGDIYADPESKINFQMNIKLTGDVPWVDVPSSMCLMNAPRTFSIQINPTGLPPGEHFTWVKGYDASCMEKGPVFNFPVTVIKTIQLPLQVYGYETSLHLRAGKVFRQFFEVPVGATSAALHISPTGIKRHSSVVVHAIQIRPQKNCKTHEFYKMFRLGINEEVSCNFSVKEKYVLEVAIVQWWTCLECAEMKCKLTFHGLQPDQPNIVMHGADGIHRIDLQALHFEEVSPSAVLKSYALCLRPSESKIYPLGSRDIFPNGRQIYANKLTYTFNMTKSSEITPIFSLLSELLYESEFESQLWMLFDHNKQLLAVGDAYPSKYVIKVEKGEYTLKLQIRHEDVSSLEKLSDAPIIISMKLNPVLSLDIYDKHSNALINGKKMNSQPIYPGYTMAVFIAPIANDKFPKNSIAGNYFSGSISFVKDELAKKVDTYNVKYIIAEMPKKSSSKHTEVKTLEEEYLEEEKQLKINWISKATGKLSKDIFDGFYQKEKNNQFTVLLARLQSMEKERETMTDVEDKKNHLLEMIHLADSILLVVDQIKVLAMCSLKTEKKDSPHYKKAEQQKNCITETLSIKGKAMCEFLHLFRPPSIEPFTIETERDIFDRPVVDKSSGVIKMTAEDITLNKIAEIYLEVQKLCDLTDSKVSSFVELAVTVFGYYGKALKCLLKQQEEKRTLATEKKCIGVLLKLGWKHCAELYLRSSLVRYPLSYASF